MSFDVREIAHRAAQKVLAERGRTPASERESSATPASAVQVSVRLETVQRSVRGGRELVTAQCLSSIADGATFDVPDGAVVTPLAEEEAHRRGIRLLRRGGAALRRVAVGADHGGFALKRELLGWVTELGFQVVDFGTRDENPVDYPDFARAVAEAVASGQCDLGVVIDGAGIGSAIAASKVPGVRAATCCDVAMAKNAREHNFANVLSLGSKGPAAKAAREILRAFLTTDTGAERHRRRVEKIDQIEQRYSRTSAPRA